MKIAHISTRHRRGGAERNVNHWIAWQLREGHDVALITGPDCVEDEIPAGAEWVVIPSMKRDCPLAEDMHALCQLRRILRAGRFDLVHTHQSKAGAIGRLASIGLDARVWHSVHMPSFGQGYPRAKSLVFNAVEHACAQRTHAFVFVGEELRELYVRRRIVRTAAAVVIASPIDVSRYLESRGPDAHSVAKAREKLGLRRPGRVIVTIGALDPRKRHALAISRLREFLITRDATLVIAGEGPEREELVATAARGGLSSHVVLPGYVHDVAGLLVAADVVVHTALVEGVPQVLVQAAAAGVPIVATPAVGLRDVPGEVIVVDETGCGIADAVTHFLEQPPRPADAEAFERWAEPVIERQISALHRREFPQLRDGTCMPAAVKTSH